MAGQEAPDPSELFPKELFFEINNLAAQPNPDFVTLAQERLLNIRQFYEVQENDVPKETGRRVGSVAVFSVAVTTLFTCVGIKNKDPLDGIFAIAFGMNAFTSLRVWRLVKNGAPTINDRRLSYIDSLIKPEFLSRADLEDGATS